MPIAVRDDLSEEALLALLDEGSESETLDYKKLCNIAIPFTFLQIVKDVAAMQLRGGYIVIGADDHGGQTRQQQHDVHTRTPIERPYGKVPATRD